MSPDRISNGDERDPYEEEEAPHGMNAPVARLQESMTRLWEEFREGLLESRDFEEMHEELVGIAQWFESGELTGDQYAVEVLAVLNRYAEPLTRQLMDYYEMPDFALTPADFKRVCLDFLSSKHGERMIVDADSVPEDLDEVPMGKNEIGDTLVGTLVRTEKGRWYVEGKDGRWCAIRRDLPEGPLLSAEGKRISATMYNGAAREITVLE